MDTFKHVCNTCHGTGIITSFVPDPDKEGILKSNRENCGNCDGLGYKESIVFSHEEGEKILALLAEQKSCFEEEHNKHDLVQTAYKILVEVDKMKKPTKTDMAMAIQEAIGYLGQYLDD